MALSLHIPALLQTTDHARAMLREAVPPFLPYELEHRLSYRIKRQEILHRSVPLPYTALLHEAALRMQYGGADIARDQLAHLLERSEQDNIIIRVIPLHLAAFPRQRPVLRLRGRLLAVDEVLDVPVLVPENACQVEGDRPRASCRAFFISLSLK